MIEKQDVPTLRRSSGGSQHPAKAGIWQALEEHGDGYQLHGMHIHLFLSHLYQSVDAKHLASRGVVRIHGLPPALFGSPKGQIHSDRPERRHTKQRWPGARKEEDPGADITS